MSPGEEPEGKTNSIATISRPSESVQGQIEAMGCHSEVGVDFVGNRDIAVIGMRRRRPRPSALGIFRSQRFPSALCTSESRRDERRRPTCSCRLSGSIGNGSEYRVPSRILLGLCRGRRKSRRRRRLTSLPRRLTSLPPPPPALAAFPPARVLALFQADWKLENCSECASRVCDLASYSNDSSRVSSKVRHGSCVLMKTREQTGLAPWKQAMQEFAPDGTMSKNNARRKNTVQLHGAPAQSARCTCTVLLYS